MGRVDGVGSVATGELNGESRDFWQAGTTAAGLSRETLERAFALVEEQIRTPHEHVLHPDSHRHDGWYICTCGPVPVHGGKVDWAWGMAHIGSSGTPHA